MLYNPNSMVTPLKTRLERFNNTCQLAEAIPTYILKLSLNGAFWRELEKVLAVSQ